MISDNIRGTAAVAALASLAMLASAGVASAAAIGTPIAVDKTNTFTADETVDLLGGDLGEAANFGLVGFDSIRLNAHTNSNIATAHAYVGAAFGNHAAGVDEPEVSYLGKVDGSINVSLPADSRIVFGASTDIGQTDNGDSWTVNGNKLEMQTGGSLPKSERVLKDSKVKYLDLKAMERSMTALSAKWAKTAPANASHDFSDMNRRHITADGDEAHLDIDAAELQGNRVTAALGERTRLVVNVDAKGADAVTLPQLDVDGINHAEYAHWTDKGVIYNLTDSKSEDGQYHGRVGTAGATSSVILAPEADVDASQNVEGQIIARNVVIGGEFHRNSVNVPITRHVEVRLDGQDKTETTPFVAPQPAREHYRFIVWTTNPDGTGDSYKPGDTVSDVAKGTTLYPQWEARHVLRYDMNGGDGEYGDSDLPADVTDTVPTREGYEFDGWTIDGVKVDSDNTVEDNGSDVTVVAQWTPVRQDATPTKPDTPKNDTDKPSGKTDNGSDDSGKTDTDKPSDTPSKGDSGKTDNGSNDSGKTDTDKPSKDDSGKTDTDKPSGTDTPSKDDGKDDNGSNDSGKTDTDKPSDIDTNVPSKDDSGKTDADKPSGTDTPSKDDGKDDNGSNDSGKTDTDKPSDIDTNVPSKDDSGKTDADKPSDANTPKGQSDATSKAESPKDGLASTGVAVAVVAVAVVVLAAGAIALAILGKRK